MKVTAGILISILILVGGGEARACSCCAERGHWSRIEGSLDEGYHDHQFGWIRHAKYSGILNSETAHGGNLGGSISGRRLVFVDPTETGAPQIMQFDFSGTFTKTMADIRDKSRPMGALLFKEWVFSGRITLIADQIPERVEGKARLIIHAYGDFCMADGDLERWILQRESEGSFYTVADGTVDDGPNTHEWYLGEHE